MTESSDIIMVGPLRARLGTVAAFLLVQEQQPPMDHPQHPGKDPKPQELEQYEADLAEYDRVMIPWWETPLETAITLERTQTLLEGLGRLLERLVQLESDSDSWTEENIQFEFYEAAKATFGTEKAQIREFFRYCYQLVTQTPNGPRWGQFVLIFGLDNFLEVLQDRFDTAVRG